LVIFGLKKGASTKILGLLPEKTAFLRLSRKVLIDRCLRRFAQAEGQLPSPISAKNPCDKASFALR
jgi:hypothetical protein